MIEPHGGELVDLIVSAARAEELKKLQRDRKGLYAKARTGIIKQFTGISDPYEEPDDSELALNTTEMTPEEAAQQVILHLEKEGFIGVPD